jgi:hypothetical protein
MLHTPPHAVNASKSVSLGGMNGAFVKHKDKALAFRNLAPK